MPGKAALWLLWKVLRDQLATILKKRYAVLSRHVMVAVLVSLNKGTVAMLVSPNYPPGIELYSYADIFFCFG